MEEGELQPCGVKRRHSEWRGTKCAYHVNVEVPSDRLSDGNTTYSSGVTLCLFFQQLREKGAPLNKI